MSNKNITDLLIGNQLLIESYSNDVDEDIYPKFLKIKKDIGKANYLREKEAFIESLAIIDEIEKDINKLKDELKKYPKLPDGFINKLKDAFSTVSKYSEGIDSRNYKEPKDDNDKIDHNSSKIKYIFNLLKMLQHDCDILKSYSKNHNNKKIIASSFYFQSLYSYKNIRNDTDEFDKNNNFNDIKNEIDKKINKMLTAKKKKENPILFTSEFKNYAKSRKLYIEKNNINKKDIGKYLELDIKFIIKLIYKYQKEEIEKAKNEKEEFEFTKLYCKLFEKYDYEISFEIIDGDQEARMYLRNFIYEIGECLEIIYNNIACNYGDGDEGCIYIGI